MTRSQAAPGLAPKASKACAGSVLWMRTTLSEVASVVVPKGCSTDEVTQAALYAL